MIDTLYVNGCSWTAGNELECDPGFKLFIESKGWKLQDPSDPINWNLVDAAGNLASRVDEHYNTFNWAGRLQKLLKVPKLINDAAGGGSNDRILRTTVQRIMSMPERDRKRTLVVIGWTASDRSEIYVGNDWHRFNATQPFSSTADRYFLPDETVLKKIDKFQEDYILNVFSDYQRVHNYFQTVYLLSNLLDNLKIKYYFFNALPAWWIAGSSEVSCNVQGEFPEQLMWHDNHNKFHPRGDSMFKYVFDNKCPPAPYGHPMFQGHEMWANHLLGTMKTRRIL